MDINVMIGRKLNRLREDNNLTQEALGIELGVQAHTISRYEHGELHMKVEMLMKASECLHVPVGVFFSPEPLTFNVHGSHSANGYVEQHNTDTRMQEKLLVHIEERSKQLEALFLKTLALFELFAKTGGDQP